MTAIPARKSLQLKKNKTGLFAANTIREIQSSRNHLITAPTLSPRYHHNSLTSVLFTSSEQKQIQPHRSSNHDIEQHHPTDETTDKTGEPLNNYDRRNAFPPSTVRHYRIRSKTTSPQRTTNIQEGKVSPSKSNMIQSHASAKLRSEIGYLHNKLRNYDESNKSLRLRDSRDIDGTFSYSTSYRFLSASTIFTADRIHKRFSSAATHQTTNTHKTTPKINDASTQTIPILPNMLTSTAPLMIETDNKQQDRTDYRPTHAYQIPQQANVGSGSIFLTEPAILSSLKTRSAKTDRSSNDLKSVACPFHVMYFTNLAMQQAQTIKNENLIAPSTVRKVPVNSRTTTAVSRHQSTRRHVNSRLSINTYLTIDDNVYVENSTPFSHRNHLSMRIDPHDTADASRLGDILRTSSCNHVKV